MRRANSRHHYTREELFELQQAMNKTSGEFTNIEAPKNLKSSQKKEFYDLAYKLLSYGMSELDEFMLAAFVQHQELYYYYTDEQRAVMKSKPINKWKTILEIEDDDLKELITEMFKKVGVIEAKDYQQLAEKEYKICKNCADALGLTISSRCKLLIPKNEDYEEL